MAKVESLCSTSIRINPEQGGWGWGGISPAEMLHDSSSWKSESKCFHGPQCTQNTLSKYIMYVAIQPLLQLVCYNMGFKNSAPRLQPFLFPESTCE